jgi:hypothetical protein
MRSKIITTAKIAIGFNFSNAAAPGERDGSLGTRNQRPKISSSGMRDSNPRDHAATVKPTDFLWLRAFELFGVVKSAYPRG